MIIFFNLHKINATYRNELIECYTKVLDKGWYILGEEVEKFEQSFAKYCGVKHCIGVDNGLNALILVIRGYVELGYLNEGDEVIVPANTYIATILAVSHSRLKPVLVEPDTDTYNINPELIEEKITENTKAILPVHLYGQTADMDLINELAIKYNSKN